MVMYITPLLLCADGDMYTPSFMLMYILSGTPYMLTVVMTEMYPNMEGMEYATYAHMHP